MAGVSRLQYSTEIKIIRVMCTGRVDLAFIFRAFLKGADGVLVAGCWPGECHYVTEGNYDALGNMYLGKKLLEHAGINPDRLGLEWIAASEGIRFAERMDAFVGKVKEIGRLGAAEGMDNDRLLLNLEAVNMLIPYVKLVERQRLRAPSKSEEAYKTFFSSDEVQRLFDELIGEKLTISRIVSLLRKGPLSAADIADKLDLNPAEVTGHMNRSSRQGLVRYDVQRKCYALV